MTRKIALALTLFAFAVAADAQIVVGTFTGSVMNNEKLTPISGYVAYVNIYGGSVTPFVTPPLKESGACHGKGTVALTNTVKFFSSNSNLVLATNANLGPQLSSYPPGTCGFAYGLLKNNGQQVNPLQTVPTAGPTIFFLSKKQVWAGIITQEQASAAQWAVAGWTGTSGGGTMLVSSGDNQGPTAEPVPTEFAPRVAAGVTRDGTTLILAMVNGDEPNKVGLQLPEFADLLRGLGAWNAVNLDGGGSSTFVYLPGSRTIVQDASLLKLFQDAKPVSNRHGLTWKLSLVGANQPCVSYPNAKVPAEAPLCLTAPKPDTEYRSIYANWGFSVTPAAK